MQHHIIPNDLHEVTPEWLKKILNLKAKPNTWKTVHNVHEGTGFLSLMSRIEFEDEIETGKKHNLIVKLLPSLNASVTGARDIVLNDKYDKIEILTYKELLPKLCEEFPVLEKYVCKAFYAEIQEEDLKAGNPYNSVIVMEDLNTLGYSTVNFADYIDEKYFFQGLDFLANFHVSSLCLEKRANSSLINLYPWSVSWYNPEKYEESKLPGLYSFFSDCFPILYKLFAKNSQAHLIPVFQKIEACINDVLKIILLEGQKNPCMIHGDLWPHNMLVHDEMPIKVIDWQLLGYTDLCYDVTAFIVATLNTENLTVDSLKNAFKYYYKKYNELCIEHGIKPTRTLEQFEKSSMTYGLAYTLIWTISGTECLTNLKVNGDEKLIKIYELYETLKVPEFMFSLISSP